jgi:hypothetical protein
MLPAWRRRMLNQRTHPSYTAIERGRFVVFRGNIYEDAWYIGRPLLPSVIELITCLRKLRLRGEEYLHTLF